MPRDIRLKMIGRRNDISATFAQHLDTLPDLGFDDGFVLLEGLLNVNRAS